MHCLLVQHGRSCIHCSANGVTSCSPDHIIQPANCPIKHLMSTVTKTKTKRPAAKKGKGKAKKEESDSEDDE
jgi:hypothetical protein